jgi:anaerobic selenocysteine-containing dehydrogenase
VVDADNAASLGDQWGFEVPATPGMTAPEMLDAAGRDELDVLFSAGGNFVEVLPDSAKVEREMARIPLRVHMDIVASSQMLIDPAEEVILLPATTRYEMPGGVTETSTERRVIFSPEIPGPRIGEARPEWQVMSELAARVQEQSAQESPVPSADTVFREEVLNVGNDSMSGMRRQDSAVTDSIHRNLRIVDNFIAMCEKSVREQPDNPMAREYLYGAYQQKAELLATAMQDGTTEGIQ